MQPVSSLRSSDRNNGQICLGRIVVHDRARVESEVLPRYFNHASFASLRRQLNYFSFTRLGKGRQRGATYCNEDVIELNDILRLRRRAVGTTVLQTQDDEQTSLQLSNDKESTPSHSVTNNRSSTIINSVVPVVHLPPSKRPREPLSFMKSKKPRKNKFRTPIISPPNASPVNHPTSDDDEQFAPRITLDLTVPTATSVGSLDTQSLPSTNGTECPTGGLNDEEILAGCNALLSFSNGFANRIVGTT